MQNARRLSAIAACFDREKATRSNSSGWVSLDGYHRLGCKKSKLDTLQEELKRKELDCKRLRCKRATISDLSREWQGTQSALEAKRLKRIELHRSVRELSAKIKRLEGEIN